jgi:hypothetical protein
MAQAEIYMEQALCNEIAALGRLNQVLPSRKP